MNEKQRGIEILLKEIQCFTSDCIERASDVISQKYPMESYSFESISFFEDKVEVHFIESGSRDFMEYKHVELSISDMSLSLREWDDKVMNK